MCSRTEEKLRAMNYQNYVFCSSSFLFFLLAILCILLVYVNSFSLMNYTLLIKKKNMGRKDVRVCLVTVFCILFSKTCIQVF